MPTGIVNRPEASGVSGWLRTMMAPPAALAICPACQRSGGHVVVREVGIASRLNQYGYGMSSTGMVPVALSRNGVPTTARGADSSSVKPDASAGPAATARASMAAAVPISARVRFFTATPGGRGTSRGEARPAR